ncbi:helix-turn-helix domain-containing protein [Nocardioides sp. BGMRC 2183]|nr:helix-turn-helix domain-containing protein [Nocardioides sp. BGMRC 2183]
MSTELSRLLTIDDLAKVANVPRNTVRSWVRENRVPYLKAGQLVRFDPDEIRAWLRRHHPQVELPQAAGPIGPIIVVQLTEYTRTEMRIPEFNSDLLVEGRGVFVPVIASVDVAECRGLALRGRPTGAFLHSPACPVSLSIYGCLENPDDASIARCPQVDLGGGCATEELSW